MPRQRSFLEHSEKLRGYAAKLLKVEHKTKKDLLFCRNVLFV